MNIITGRRGQPHVTSQQQRDTNTAIFSGDSCVLNVGKQLRAERIDTNTIRIYDGQASIQGCIVSIEANEYEDVTITNGTIGKQRYDLIAAHYTKTEDGTGQYVEDVSLIVIKGAEVDYSEESSVLPFSPTVTDSKSIRDGATEYDFSLYQVHIQEFDIVDVEPLFNVANYDTGWVDVTFSRYFKNSGEETKLQYRRIGKQVEIRGEITPTQKLVFDANVSYDIGYIPEDCAPSKALQELCQGTSISQWMLTLRKDGVIKMSRLRQGNDYRDLQLQNWCALHIMYFID